MEDVKPEQITYVKVPLERDDVLEAPKESFFEMVRKAQIQATHEGIKANTIVINKNIVKVPSFVYSDGIGGVRITRDMVCGMNVVLTKDELPENYSFAIFEGPPDRLAQFEAIGMEPAELQKAADLYRKIKEEMG
jgi:hypothetical protein